jgi:hypothetical protein
VGIHNKSNHLFNQPATKEEIDKVMQEILKGNIQQYFPRFAQLLQQQILPATDNINVE